MTQQQDGKNILREQRAIKGMTQKQVADKANIKLQQYQKFESGERNIMNASFQIACRVLEALDLDITAYFYFRENKSEGKQDDKH